MFLNGQAFVLAEKLESGKPCPVCGALEHPHPALSGDGHVTEKDVKDAEFLMKKAEAASKEDQQKAEEYRMKKVVVAKGNLDKSAAVLDELEKTLPDGYRDLKILEKK